jgi:Flp pilus assembly protein TadD
MQTRHGVVIDRAALYNLGLLLDERGQHAQALAVWQQGADDGNHKCTFALGLMAHRAGDRTEAVGHWRVAALLGHAGPRANLREFYPETHI